ncbi:YugN-like family protein [Paenibacillus spongiae]|uniref:YugN-like family protein n=1 Tax=Paenibacillus spongiae TaxID=2909671 RepID=A0ABY5SCW5_9BACL|nr:YugN-like family protein [Paenibacillus spongiae]UVI31792.1 YugN-like family protein [Paenibacillus spongiae]
MIPLSSKLQDNEQEFVEMRTKLANYNFSLGGNWEYDHGSFDRSLDEANMVWLRLPFDVTNGNLDGETTDNDAKIRFGQPFVLKHVYEEGLDSDAQSGALGSFVDQFQSPSDPDAEIEPHWVDKAKQVLGELEQVLPQ